MMNAIDPFSKDTDETLTDDIDISLNSTEWLDSEQ